MLGGSSNEKKSDEESDYEASESSEDINGDDEGKSTMITRRRKSRDDDNVSLVNKEKSTMITRRRKSRDDSARNSGISIREPTVSSILKKQKRDTLPSSIPTHQVNINGGTNTTTSSSESWSIPTAFSRSNLEDFISLMDANTRSNLEDGTLKSSLASESTRSLSINPNSVQAQPQGNITRSSTSSRPQRYLMIAPLAADTEQRLYGFIQQPPYLPIPRGVPLCIPIVNFDDKPIQTVPGYTRVPLDATTAMCWGLFTNPSSPSLNGFNFVPSLFQGNNTLPAVSSVLGSSVEAQANDTRRWASEMLNNQEQQQNHSYLAPQATGPYDLRQLLPAPQANAFPGYTQAQMEANPSNLDGPSFIDSPSFQGNMTRPSTVNLHRQISVSGLSPSSSLEAQADVVGGCNSGLLPNDQQQQQHHPSSMDVRGLDLNLPADNEDEGFDLNQPARNE